MSVQGTERAGVIRLFAVSLAAIFILRLAWVQLADDKYKVFAQNNALRKEIISPPRGVLYDRHGVMLVDNATIYDVMVVPSRVAEFDTAALCKLLDFPLPEFRKSWAKAVAWTRYRPSPIVREITPAQYGYFQERAFEFQGFYVQSRISRSYPQPIGASFLGYLAEADSADIAQSDAYYRLGDYMGKSGIEKSYENQLRGTKGTRFILVDVFNREQGRYLEGAQDVQPINGQDLITGIDAELQAYAEKLLRGKKGAIVAIEPATGEILCMVTAPSYDPNVLLGRSRSKNLRKLYLDPRKPMFNRALTAKYPPGSTLKPAEGLIGLAEGVISPSYVYNCSGAYWLSGSQKVGCHSAGSFDLHNSIRLSCNSYYCNVFRLLIEEPRLHSSAAGLENWGARLQAFGVGIKTGIDIPNESKGIMPTAAYYDKIYGQRRWHATTIISLGIGQGEISLTPLQMANMCAAIANGGYYINPHFVRSIGGQPNPNLQKFQTSIDTAYFTLMRLAMRDVVERGTAGWVRMNNIEVCGKTGTAQNPHGKDHSLFIGFSPMNNPKIAIAVIIENAGFGGSWAAPAASLVIEKYFSDSIARPWVEKRIREAVFDPLPDDSLTLENLAD